MTPTLPRDPDRSPAAPAPLAARGRGWPAAVPFDPGLDRAAGILMADRERFGPLRDRLAAHGFRQSALEYGAWLAAAPTVWVVGMLVFSSGRPLLGGVLFLAAIGTTAIDIRRYRRRVLLPRCRAALRASGLDVCVRCGYPISGTAPTSPCPECAFPHEDFPLGQALVAADERD